MKFEAFHSWLVRLVLWLISSDRYQIFQSGSRCFGCSKVDRTAFRRGLISRGLSHEQQLHPSQIVVFWDTCFFHPTKWGNIGEVMWNRITHHFVQNDVFGEGVEDIQYEILKLLCRPFLLGCHMRPLFLVCLSSSLLQVAVFYGGRDPGVFVDLGVIRWWPCCGAVVKNQLGVPKIVGIHRWCWLSFRIITLPPRIRPTNLFAWPKIPKTNSRFVKNRQNRHRNPTRKESSKLCQTGVYFLPSIGESCFEFRLVKSFFQ